MRRSWNTIGLMDMLDFFDFYLKDTDTELPGVVHLESLGSASGGEP